MSQLGLFHRLMKLLGNQNLAEAKKVEKFKSKRNNLTTDDIVFWRKYLDYHYKKNIDLLEFLRKICPDISKCETCNNRVINLTDWFIVVEEIGHSATHSNFVIKTKRTEDWSKPQQEMLKKYFSGIIDGREYRLNTTRENASFSLDLFSEYSFQIYKFLSIDRGYDWDILRKQKER